MRPDIVLFAQVCGALRGCVRKGKLLQSWQRSMTMLYSISAPSQTSMIRPQVIAEVDEGGLGLPDRDLYLKQDANLQALRQTYLAHVQKMLGLLGEPPDATAAAADAAIRIETVLAKASLTRTERRDPQKMYHKMTRKELAVLSPSFDWDSYFAKIEFSSTMPLNVTSPEFLGAMNAELEREDLPSWKAYLRWHLIHASAPHLSPHF